MKNHPNLSWGGQGNQKPQNPQGFQQPPYQQEKKPNLEEMLSKFLSVSETHLQNTEIALKNQQALIQRLETQIGQLSKLISERPQGSLPSNTEPNPREHLNAISTQDKEGFIAPELELMQETVVSKGKSEKLSFKEAHEPCSRNDRGHIHEERRLRIEELDEWYHVIVKRKENRPTYFEEEEGSVLFRGPNRENPSPSPTISPKAPGRTVPNTSGPNLNYGPLHRLDYRADIPRAHDGTMLNVPSSDHNDKCWHTLAPSTASYNPSRSKASVLPPSLASSTPTKSTSYGACRKGTSSTLPISSPLLFSTRRSDIGKGLLNTAIQESSLTLIGQMSPQGISSMLSMRMIERRRGTYPLQYLLAQSTQEEAYEDIPDYDPPTAQGPTDSATTILPSSSCGGIIC
ncbi:hypothetical protein GOBAR_AA10494 [Gossypium barbadense]|uniref:Uncharacterized protein n=1 Tax=Gossypium barbadense TaxID=3634 RepID=A0A2P5Y3G0_GOSBA|nr:hypothetical protein GOBAR_AA10494 [Gossypium barbadense]